MNKIPVPFADTHQFSSLVDDYLSGSPVLRPFYRYTPEPASFEKAIERRITVPVNREVLTERLTVQYGNLLTTPGAGSNAVRESIQALRNDKCFTITTGHQLNIFTGPLYSIYKIATTIKLARELSERYGEYRFVPVFWMASEDHDLNEIRQTSLYGKEVTWDHPEGGAVGRMDLSGMAELLKQVAEIIGKDGACLNLFRDAYGGSGTLAQATREIMHGLFGTYGLVVIDGDDSGLKRLFIDEMRDDLVHHKAWHAVNETSERLSKSHKVQVNARPVNLFYLQPGKRERIVRQEDGTYEVLNTDKRFTADAILDELNRYPEHFSPNVVLRPVYQEKILPNLAYIGGPGELNYWLQFMGAFEAHRVEFPVLILRNCILLLDKNTMAKTVKLGLTVHDLFKSVDYQVLKVLEATSNVHAGTETVMERVQQVFHELSVSWEPLDASLVPTIEAEKQKVIKGIHALEEKARRAMKRKNEQLVNQVKNTRDKLFPNGGLQERTENFLPYYCRYGDPFLRDLIGQVDPFTKHFLVLTTE